MDPTKFLGCGPFGDVHPSQTNESALKYAGRMHDGWRSQNPDTSSRLPDNTLRPKAPPKRSLNGAPLRLLFRNRVFFVLFFLVAVVGPSLSQTPQVYTYEGMSLNRSGFIPVSGIAGLGLNIETDHFSTTAESSIDNVHSRNSLSGFEIAARTRIFDVVGRGWAFGAGAQWNKLASSTYSKQVWRPSVGAFKDFKHPDFSARIQLMYAPPVLRSANSLQLAEIGFWLPSPATRGHFFYRELASISEFRRTSSPHRRQFKSFVEFTIMYRR